MKTWAAGGALALVASTFAGVPSPTAPDTSLDAHEAVAAVLEADQELLSAHVAQTPGRDGSVTTRNEGTLGVLDATNGGAVTLTSDKNPGDSITIQLEDSEHLDGSVTDSSTSITTYEHPDGFIYVPVLRTDGTVQAHTVIEGSSAPTRFDYEVGVPDGGRLESAGDSILILDRDGNMVGGFAPAWAKDADGRSVDTHYEVNGLTLTQVVEHDETVTYPVVADPWAGINLFGHVYTDWYKNAMRVNASLSPWGWTVYSGAATRWNPGQGQIILNTYGLTEVLSRGQDVRDAFASKQSMYQQFSCHVLGALVAGQWNLEAFRPTLTVSWLNNVANHHCNWNYSDGRV